jgi:hypothetical protein
VWGQSAQRESAFLQFCNRCYWRTSRAAQERIDEAAKTLSGKLTNPKRSRIQTRFRPRPMATGMSAAVQNTG